MAHAIESGRRIRIVALCPYKRYRLSFANARGVHGMEHHIAPSHKALQHQCLEGTIDQLHELRNPVRMLFG